MKKLIFILSIILIYGSIWAQTTGDYKTRQNGAWSATSTWLIYNGSAWVTCTSIPSDAVGVITITSGTVVHITNDISIDQTTVESGATLEVNSGNKITIQDGSGDDFTVNGVFNLNGSLEKASQTVINGTMNWTGVITANGSITINSGGNINISGDGAGFYDDGGDALTINNEGIIKKTAGNDTTDFNYTELNNNGTVSVESGTINITNGTNSGTYTISSGKYLNISSGTDTFNDGAIVNGDGTFQLTGGSINANGTTTGAVIDNNVTFNFSAGSIKGSGKLTVNGIMNWTSSGSLTLASLTIPSGAFLNISGDNDKSFRYGDGTIYNSGTITWTGSGNIRGASKTISNLSGGIFDIQNDAGFYNDGGGGGAFTINNEGIIKKTAGNNTTDFNYVSFNNSGTLQVDVGTFVLGSTFSNFSSNALNSGVYNITGIFKFNNANILTNNATIVLNGATSQILNNTGDADALVNLTTIGTSGSFTLENGRNFSTNASTFTNNGILDCGTNIFSGGGNFSNAAGATLKIGSPDGITSSGASGNIQSSGSRTYSTEANYFFNGTAAQVTGNGFPAEVNNLTIDNNAGVSLTSSVTVANNLNLTSGNISTGTEVLTLGKDAANLGTLSRTSGSIIGNFKRWFASSTVSDILFAVGTTGNYRPATISFVVAPTSGGTINCIFNDTSPGENGLPLDDDGTLINKCSNEGYWTLTSGDGLSGGTYDIDLNADGFGGITDYTSLRVLKRSDSGSDWTLHGVHSEGTGSNSTPVVHRTGMSGFSDFGVGSPDGNLLPVELISFTANVVNEKVLLEWKTETEINNYGFEIEKAEWVNGYMDEWNKIGFAEGYGNSNSAKAYLFTDKVNKASKYSYRLKQIDIDGTFEYSDIVEVTVGAPTRFDLYQNYPNPFNPSTIIKYSIPVVETEYMSSVQLKIYDILGREVATLVNKEQSPGNYEVKFDADKLTSGIYLYRLTAESKAGRFIQTRKMILMK